MDTEDLSIQDDPKSKKKYMFLSKFVSIVKGDHDFALRLALNVMANAVQASRTNQDDTSKEMLSFIKSQLEFMRTQYKAAQTAEKEAARTVMSLRDNINKITRQITDWETPRSRKLVTDYFDFNTNMSPSKGNHQLTPNQTKDFTACGILAQPALRPCSPLEKRNIVSGENSPKTPKSNKRLATSDKLTPHKADSPNKALKMSSDKKEFSKSISISNIGSPSTGIDRNSVTPSTSSKLDKSWMYVKCGSSNVDNHGFLKFNSAMRHTT